MFYCPKAFYSIPIQALVNPNYIFRFCASICTGETHGSLEYSVFRLKREIGSGILIICYEIIEDEPYSYTEHIIEQCSKSNADTDQDIFNVSIFLAPAGRAVFWHSSRLLEDTTRCVGVFRKQKH